VASSAWLQLILFGLRNCGQSVFNFPLSSRPEVESEGLPFPAPKKHPLLVWIWGNVGQVLGLACASWQIVLLQDLKTSPASCHLSLGRNCKIDCWLQGATMGRRGAKFSLVLIKSQTAFPCGTRSFSLRRVFFRGFVNELAQQNRIKNTSKLMTLRPGEAEFCVERKLVATSTASHSKCGQHLCNLFSWLFAELLDARACC